MSSSYTCNITAIFQESNFSGEIFTIFFKFPNFDSKSMFILSWSLVLEYVPEITAGSVYRVCSFVPVCVGLDANFENDAVYGKYGMSYSCTSLYAMIVSYFLYQISAVTDNGFLNVIPSSVYSMLTDDVDEVIFDMSHDISASSISFELPSE